MEKDAKTVNYGKPKGHLDTQLFVGWDPVKHHRERMKREQAERNRSKKSKS